MTWRAYHTATETATTQDQQLKEPGCTLTTEEIKDVYNSKPYRFKQAILNYYVEEVVLAIGYNWLSISNHWFAGSKDFLH